MKWYFARRLMLNRVESTCLGGAVRHDVGASTVLLHPTLPSASWNFAVDLDTNEAGLERLVTRIEAEFAKAKRWPAFLTGPYDRPKDVAERLAALGYMAEVERTIMYVDQKPTIKAEAPPGLEIELADDATADECVMIAVQRYGWPHEWAKSLRRSALAGMERGPDHYRMYYASLNGAGVATAFIVFSAGTAGLYGMATSKDFEGQGIGRALLAHCAAETFERGVDVMTLQVPTASKAERFYEGAGFQKAYVGRRFVKKKGEKPRGQPKEEE